MTGRILVGLWLSRRDRIAVIAWTLGAGIAIVSIMGLALHGIPVVAVERDAIQAGEVWRFLTGPILHGGPIHGIMNVVVWIWLTGWCASLFGRRVVIPVFLVSMLCGAVATITIGSGGPSVGISGGLMGLIGLLGVAAYRWRDCPMPGLATTVLLNLGLIAGLGLIGVGIIDNAAHLGGLLGGAALGYGIVPRAPGPRVDSRLWVWAERCAIAALSAAIIGAGWLIWRVG